jgi:Major capsid protein Gp23
MNLIQNWTETKGALLEGLQGSKKQLVDTLLENQKRALLETAGPASANVAADANTFQNIMMPMVRRIIPGTIGTDLVGMQPMTGPVGLVYSLRFAFADQADAAGTVNDIAVGDEAFVYNSKMKRFYSSSNVGTAGYPPALTAATSNGFASTTADAEGFGGRAMRLNILKQTVTAGSRKLQARWTQESMQDLGTHGLNIASEMTAALSGQIAHEIDNEILTDLMQLAGTTATYDFAAAPAGFSPNYIGDRYAELGVLVNRMANEVGAKTKRAPANWLVGGHLITSILQSASKSVFAPAVSGTFEAPTGNRLVGTLNGAIKVYSYNWGLNDNYDLSGGTHNAAGTDGEDILIGYKGGNSELDAGYFYCPYVPLMSTGTLQDANTFMHATSLMTRYGKATFTNTSTSLGNSSDYYARVLVKNVAFS